MNSRNIGNIKEKQACDYLSQQGLKCLVRNYQCQLGEIDLIMQDKSDLVFVEVRFRRQDRYGDGATTVSRSKQRKIIKTATVYLLEKQLYDKIPCRFDVISLGGDDEQMTYNWIKNAFQ